MPPPPEFALERKVGACTLHCTLHASFSLHSLCSAVRQAVRQSGRQAGRKAAAAAALLCFGSAGVGSSSKGAASAMHAAVSFCKGVNFYEAAAAAAYAAAAAAAAEHAAFCTSNSGYEMAENRCSS